MSLNTSRPTVAARSRLEQFLKCAVNENKVITTAMIASKSHQALRIVQALRLVSFHPPDTVAMAVVIYEPGFGKGFAYGSRWGSHAEEPGVRVALFVLLSSEKLLRVSRADISPSLSNSEDSKTTDDGLPRSRSCTDYSMGNV